MAKNTNPVPAQDKPQEFTSALNRRNFLRYTGAGVAVSALLLTTGCDDDDDVDPGTTPPALSLIHI